MKTVKHRYHLYPFVLLLTAAFIGAIFSSCSNSRYLNTGEKLYTGADIHVIPDSGTMTRKQQKEIESELNSLTRPKPNSRFLGIFRARLWLYNVAGKPTGKGLRYLVKTKLGEPPVLLGDVDQKRNVAIISNRLENQGYYIPEVFSKVNDRHLNYDRVEYIAKTRKPYRLKHIIFPAKDSSINKMIFNTRNESYLHPGDQYNLDILKSERERISTSMKEQGLFYFSPDDIIFKADTTAGDHEVDITMLIKRKIPLKATEIYTLNNIYVFADHSIFKDSSKTRQDTVKVQSYYYIGDTAIYRPEIIVSSIFLEKNALYNFEDYDITLNKLMRLGIYKFVNIKFRDLDSGKKTGKLDTYIYLTPLPRKSLRFEFKLVSRSDNFGGPLINISFKNRNVFRGAETLTFNVNGSIETGITGAMKGKTTSTLGGDATLAVPRFLIPYVKINIPNKFVPKTEFKLGFQRLSEINYYNLNTYSLSAGYHWNQTEQIEHIYNPFVINFLKLGNTTSLFDSILNKNISLKRSFETQFVIGSNYTYTYNTQVITDRKTDWFFRAGIDESGNILGLAQSLFSGHEGSPDQPNRIFGEPYSQYVLGTIDLRHYFNFNKDNRFVSRFFAGAGIPYGNSATLPYIKAFFTGGNNSVRAFPSRYLGPGIYQLPADRNAAFLIDQVGDIKLEGNIEYRFPIYGVFKGAVFTDAGNIWLIHNDTARPGGMFAFNTFYKEIAVGSGFGLRIDASYFVLRFDLAFPLRRAYPTDGNYWVINAIKPGDPIWRRNNLVLNIGIGYPF